MASVTSLLASAARVGVVLGLSVITFAFGGWLAARIAVSGTEDRVPDLRGLAQEEVIEILARSGMTLQVDEDRLQDDTIPSDHVVRQDPFPGTPVKRMRTVHVMLSTGPLVQTLPNLVGDSRQRALIALEQDGIAVDYVASAPSYSLPRDTIIAQSPEANSGLAGQTHAPLRLLTSLGPPTTYYVMPKLTTRAAQDVRPVLERMGFRVTEGANRRVYANLDPGTIVSQRPRAGFRIAAGAEIVLQVSR